MEQHSYFVYIMANASGSALYIGFSGALERRVAQHKTKALPGFSRRYNITKLVYFEELSSPQEAIAREKVIKGLTRKKKMQLIKKHNPTFHDLLPLSS
ncbi:MAG: GIY-YIG nuclease family protein [Patescibacteria group bacterium]